MQAFVLPFGIWAFCLLSLPGHSTWTGPNGRKACCKPTEKKLYIIAIYLLNNQQFAYNIYQTSSTQTFTWLFLGW